MRIYISGKIGENEISETTRQKFARAEEMLKAKGFSVFNPTDKNWTDILSNEYYTIKGPQRILVYATPFYNYCLLRDLVVLNQMDGIYMLADWTQSDGANVELDFARATGKKILWENEEDAKIFTDEAGNYTDIWFPIEEKL